MWRNQSHVHNSISNNIKLRTRKIGDWQYFGQKISKSNLNEIMIVGVELRIRLS